MAERGEAGPGRHLRQPGPDVGPGALQGHPLHRIGDRLYRGRGHHERVEEEPQLERPALAHRRGVIVMKTVADELCGQTGWIHRGDGGLGAGRIGEAHRCHPSVAPWLAPHPRQGLNAIGAFVAERVPLALRRVSPAHVLEDDRVSVVGKILGREDEAGREFIVGGAFQNRRPRPGRSSRQVDVRGEQRAVGEWHHDVPLAGHVVRQRVQPLVPPSDTHRPWPGSPRSLSSPLPSPLSDVAWLGLMVALTPPAHVPWNRAATAPAPFGPGSRG